MQCLHLTWTYSADLCTHKDAQTDMHDASKCNSNNNRIHKGDHVAVSVAFYPPSPTQKCDRRSFA